MIVFLHSGQGQKNALCTHVQVSSDANVFAVIIVYFARLYCLASVVDVDPLEMPECRGCSWRWTLAAPLLPAVCIVSI